MSEGVEYLQPRRALSRTIELHEYDPAWPGVYAHEEELVRAALGDRVVRIEHAGSTSVPGLPAKPIVDMILEVPDTTDEAAYVLDLEAAGYTFFLRERNWFEHRLFRRDEPSVNLHVFSAGCEEFDRMVAFRDHLRADAVDRELYLRTKRELAAREWTYMQDYADAKSAVVADIMRRAMPGELE